MTHQNALYIVATPIGNLADITLRAIDVLRSVSVIAAEDTRHSAKLLQYHDIATPLISYHDHGGEAQVSRILAKLSEGGAVALISDAGTPLISDPGYRLVNAVREQGFDVVPVPGPCAFISAISASGLPSDRIAFEGFPPAKAQARRQVFEHLSKDHRTLVFYESTHRILACLQDMAEVFGADREICVARELSKTYETFLRGSITTVLNKMESDTNQQKGEFVVLVRGAVEENTEEGISEEAQKLLSVLCQELPVKQAASLTAKVTGEKKNKCYQWALDHPAG